MTNEQYRIYTNSNHWKRTRNNVKYDREKCEVCGVTESLYVHHKTYENIGHESDADLILLCKTCHKKEHARPDCPSPYADSVKFPTFDLLSSTRKILTRNDFEKLGLLAPQNKKPAPLSDTYSENPDERLARYRRMFAELITPPMEVTENDTIHIQ